MPFYRLISLATLFAVLLTLGGCSHNEPPLRVGTNPWPGYLGLYYARDLGLLSNDDYRLIQFDSTEDVLIAFRNHAIDAAAVTLDEALLLADNGQNPRIVLVFDTSNGADAVLARPGINRPADLRQRRIGVETNALGAYMLARLLQAGNLQPSDLSIVHLPLPEHVRAFRAGEIDAIITFDPPRSLLLQAGARPIFSSADIPGEIVDVLVVREEDLQKHQSHLRQLIASYFTAHAQLRQDTPHAAKVLASAMDIDSAALLRAWQGMELTDAATNRRLLAANSPLQATMARLAQIMHEEQLLEHVPAVQSLLHDELVKQHTQ